MEVLSPHLKLVMSLRQSLESGDSVRSAIRDYLSKNSDEVAKNMSVWLAQIEHSQNSFMKSDQSSNGIREDIFQLIFRGLQGQSILPQLILLEEELCEAAKLEIEALSTILPLKALIPLLLFQFPALLLLLFGPLLRQMLSSF